MKKILSIIIVLLLMVPAVFAGYHDSYAYMWEDPVYVGLIDALKENLDESIVLSRYGEYMAGDASDADKCMTELHLVRYFMDRGDKESAERHYENQKALYGNTAFSNETERMTAEFDLLSAEYYIWKNGLGAGLESSNVGKKLFKEDPYEYRTAVGEGFRLLSSPGIAGGSTKKALALFHEIEKDMDGMNKLDRFSLYSGLGMSSYERKEYEASKKYFALATEIYPADPAMQKYIDKLAKR